jgi:hypothetical protein
MKVAKIKSWRETAHGLTTDNGGGGGGVKIYCVVLFVYLLFICLFVPAGAIRGIVSKQQHFKKTEIQFYSDYWFLLRHFIFINKYFGNLVDTPFLRQQWQRVTAYIIVLHHRLGGLPVTCEIETTFLERKLEHLKSFHDGWFDAIATSCKSFSS